MLLALVGVYQVVNPRRQWPVILLIFGVVLALWVASGVPLKWLGEQVPIPGLAQFFTGVRHPSFIAALAVAPLLGLAALGLDRVMALPWPRISLRVGGAQPASNGLQLNLNAHWMLLIPLVMALGDVRSFGLQFIRLEPVNATIPSVMSLLRTPDLQWVATPIGEHWLTEPLVGAGMKLAEDYRTWYWKDRQPPEPYLEGHRAPQMPNVTPTGHEAGGVYLHQGPSGREYAAVNHPDGTRTLCQAQGRGGDIDVQCALWQGGTLVVRENNWSGWGANVNGWGVPLLANGWLSVELPPGTHYIQFRYRPWDVLLGLLLSAGGVALAVYVWRRPEEELPPQVLLASRPA